MEHKKTTPRILKGILTCICLILVVAVALPLLGVATILGRFILIIALPVAVLTLAFSPRLRAWLSIEREPARQVCLGLGLPGGLQLHRNHSWARRVGGGKVTVGADDLLQRALGPVTGIDLPELGKSFDQGDDLMQLRHGGRHVSIKAPVSGKVTRVNRLLSKSPDLVNHQPYDAGWIVEMSAPELAKDEGHLFSGQEARQWFREDVDTLISLLTPAHLKLQVAQDGGILVGDFHDQMNEETWQCVRRAIFGHRPDPA